MKRTLPVISGPLAINFLALVGAIAWLFYSGRLDHARVGQIKRIMFAEPSTRPSTRPSDARDPTTQPSLRLEQLLAKVAGRPASEQVEFMQRTFDAQAALIDSRVTELEKQRATLNSAQAQLTKDREKLAADQKRLQTREQEQAQLASDKGFQETLDLYTTMPPRQVKTIFMTLDDSTAVRYLRSMEPRVAGKILKEFKAPDETARATRILEAMRQSQAAAEQ